jgi:hypothetical protein
MIHEFRLSPLGKGGVSCDEGGAFVGAVPMLARTRRHGKDEWRPRDSGDLSKEMSALYGLPVDMSSKRGGLRAIANAFNDGDMARAQGRDFAASHPQSAVPFQGRAVARGDDQARWRTSMERLAQSRLGP